MLEEIKGYLKITWSDEDSSISTMIDAGKAYIDSVTGTTIDYESDNQAKSLLFDYCRYRYNMVTEEFESNFSSVILNLQLKYACKDMEVTP